MDNQKGVATLNRLDKAGIVCSGACAVHCMIVPMIAFSAPALISHFENEWVHILLILLIVPIAGVSFYRHKKIHGHTKPLRLGIVGGSLLIGAVVCEKIFGMEIKGLEMTLTILGSVLLISGHLFNMRYLKLSFPQE